MRLPRPIHQLKREAKALARKEGIALHTALDRIAAAQGFAAWSLLAARAREPIGAREMFKRLGSGDLLLLGGRPGQGKTLTSLRLAVEAMTNGRLAVFFSLDYADRDVWQCFRKIDVDPMQFGTLFEVDCSDRINAATIMQRLDRAACGTLAVIDYLQLLDHRRDNPCLTQQVEDLRTFARRRGIVMVFLSQIDRSYDPALKPCPDLNDVRLPNPLDLSLFDKTCFMQGDEVRFDGSP